MLYEVITDSTRTDIFLNDLKFQSLLSVKGEQYLIDVLGKRIRITSYNVCYTKLLRLKQYMWSYRDEGAFHEKVINQILDDLVGSCKPVLTSYSIHYTKLYERNHLSGLHKPGVRQRQL